MSKLRILIKYNLLSLYNSFSKNIKKKNKSTATIIALASLLALFIYAFIIFYILIFAFMFNEGGKPEGVILIVLTAVSMLSLMQGITRSNSTLFRMKDYDLLISMPIKNSEILMSKIISVLLGSIGLSLVIGLPAAVIYTLITQSSFWVFTTSLITIVLAPLIPLILGSFISFVFGFIPLEKKIKNILSTILYVAFMICVIGFATITPDGDEFEQIVSMYETLEKAYIFAPIAISSAKGVISSFLIFNSISLILTALFLIIVSLGFKKITALLNIDNNSKKTKKISEKEYKSSSPTKALLKKELLMYFNIPGYIINTIVGPVMSVFITYGLLSQISGGLNQNVIGEIEGIEFSKSMIVIISSLMLCFFMTLTSTSSSSISVEGKRFWILKSSPISVKSVFISKMFINLLITIPFLIIDLVMCIILVDVPVYIYIGFILIPLLVVIGTSLIGLYLNICFPKFDYDNVQKVIKSSLSVFLNMIFSLAITIVLFISSVFVLITFGEIIAIIVGTIISLAYIAVSYILLATHGVKKYNKIEF